MRALKGQEFVTSKLLGSIVQNPVEARANTRSYFPLHEILVV